MDVRTRREADVDECVAALREVHEADGYPDRWPDDPAGWLSPVDLESSWVAERAGRIVGHIALVGRDDGLWVSRLFVRPGSRGLQVGARLLREARKQGVLKLDVIEQSTSAIALYERSGWTLLGTRPAGWTMSDGTEPVERIYVSASDQLQG